MLPTAKHTRKPHLHETFARVHYVAKVKAKVNKRVCRFKRRLASGKDVDAAAVEEEGEEGDDHEEGVEDGDEDVDVTAEDNGDDEGDKSAQTDLRKFRMRVYREEIAKAMAALSDEEHAELLEHHVTSCARFDDALKLLEEGGAAEGLSDEVKQG